MCNVKQLDHVALNVADVEISVQFYRDVMGFTPLDRPAFDFPGAWFRLGSTQELHLICDHSYPVPSHHRGGHFAIAVDSLDRWEARFESAGAKWLPRKTRPDGAMQTFVSDPDGNWIELCVHASR